SLAVGTVAGFLGGAVSGLASGLLSDWQTGFFTQLSSPLVSPLASNDLPPILAGMSVGVIIPAITLGTVFGAASQMGLTLAEQKHSPTAVQRLSGVLTGTLLAVVLFGLLDEIRFVHSAIF
ncbi:MAG: hypothetical protein KDD89_08950, partial [Anaerolineales bacterium]|nr:hypothetical protein [Anaerolineales bacterium]